LLSVRAVGLILPKYSIQRRPNCRIVVLQEEETVVPLPWLL
jgi:hypothetical protein